MREKTLGFEKAKQIAEPFIKSLSNVTPYTPEFAKMRDDLAELLQDVYKDAYKTGSDETIQQVLENIKYYGFIDGCTTD